MTAGRIRLPFPHPGQQRVRAEMRRFNALCAGRRWRKSTLAMSESVEKAASGQSVLWCAPTHDQNMVSWNETKRAAGEVADFNLSRKEVLFPSGGRIIYRSLDNPDNARGHTANGVVIDEAQDVRDASAWHEVLRPMLIDTNGWALLIFTPKPGVWAVNEWAQWSGRPDSRAWQAPTLGVTITPDGLRRVPHALENPDIPFEEIEQLYRTMPERSFRQEILAEMLEFEGAVFRRIKDAIDTRPARYEPDHQYVIGCDWGRSADFSAFAVVDVTERRLVELDRSTGVEYAIQRGRLLGLCRKWQPVNVVAEMNAMGAPIVEQLQRDGVPVTGFTTSNSTKQQAIDGLALAFEQGTIGILDDPVLLAELNAFQGERLPSGMTRYSAPDGLHDDTVMALALAWWGAKPLASKVAPIKPKGLPSFQRGGRFR